MGLIDKFRKDSFHKKCYNLAKQGKYQESLEYLDKVLEIDPNDTKALFMKGTMLLRLEQYEKS